MNHNDLKMGDIVFYLDSCGIPEHIALYVCKKKETHYVVHATTVPHRGIMITYLREADLNCGYQIMRPTNTRLAHIALGIILNWVEEKIPFTTDERRYALMDILEEKNGYTPKYARVVQEQHAKATYVENYSHYLDMANALPSIPKERGVIAGLACSETIISAFNIALLIQHATYHPAAKQTENMFSFPSLSDEFIRNLVNPFPLDARAVAPAGILEHCSNDASQWLDMGLLSDHSPRPPTLEEKNEWKEFIAAYKQLPTDFTLDKPQKSFEILVPMTEQEDTELEEEEMNCFNETPSPVVFLSSHSSDSPTKLRARSLSSPYQFLDLNPKNNTHRKARSASDSTHSMSALLSNTSLNPDNHEETMPEQHFYAIAAAKASTLPFFEFSGANGVTQAKEEAKLPDSDESINTHVIS